MSMDSIGRDTSGIIWFASEHTQASEKARSGGIPALRRIEANAWQRGSEAEWEDALRSIF